MSNDKERLTVAVLIAAMLVMLSCSGQNGSRETAADDTVELKQDSTSQALISFETLEHDFGTIIEGEMVVCYFGYTNTGKGDLVIRSVEVTCGCTTPDWSAEPLRPGGQEQLQVIFDASGRSGVQRKVVTIRSNAVNSSVNLIIKAEVQDNV